ncbi:MAG: hypothetical protein PF508_03285 [Spirochaeta sp.]|nr:hypothetical protein [Spirochaeta sp.]
MSTKKAGQIGVLLILSLTVLGAQSAERPDESDEDEWEKIFDVDEYDETWLVGDTRNDGRTDYALKRDDQGRKWFEAVDFNGDGLMDDFYLYSSGTLVRQELDTNFDGAIDLWIHMHDGVRVAGYERDTNYDGTIDLVKEFGDS